MRTWHKIASEARVLSKAKRNRVDLLRYLVRRPALFAAVAAYEAALLFSSRTDNRLKLLGQVKAAALIGCPF